MLSVRGLAETGPRQALEDGGSKDGGQARRAEILEEGRANYTFDFVNYFLVVRYSSAEQVSRRLSVE